MSNPNKGLNKEAQPMYPIPARDRELLLDIRDQGFDGIMDAHDAFTRHLATAEKGVMEEVGRATGKDFGKSLGGNPSFVVARGDDVALNSIENSVNKIASASLLLHLYSKEAFSLAIGAHIKGVTENIGDLFFDSSTEERMYLSGIIMATRQLNTSGCWSAEAAFNSLGQFGEDNDLGTDEEPFSSTAAVFKRGVEFLQSIGGDTAAVERELARRPKSKLGKEGRVVSITEGLMRSLLRESLSDRVFDARETAMLFALIDQLIYIRGSECARLAVDDKPSGYTCPSIPAPPGMESMDRFVKNLDPDQPVIKNSYVESFWGRHIRAQIDGRLEEYLGEA